jgi:hypothetical protein
MPDRNAREDASRVRGDVPGDREQKYTRRQAMTQAAWWRRARFARTDHYQCRKCGTWHIGNRRTS